jgi:hypothetical protein
MALSGVWKSEVFFVAVMRSVNPTRPAEDHNNVVFGLDCYLKSQCEFMGGRMTIEQICKSQIV